MKKYDAVSTFINAIDHAYVRHILSSVIYQRAQKYYNISAVMEIQREEKKITAFVDGSGKWPYRVKIIPDLKGQVELECSCPYPDICKHIGAVLLALIAEKDELHEMTFEGLPNFSELKGLSPLIEKQSLRFDIAEIAKNRSLLPPIYLNKLKPQNDLHIKPKESLNTSIKGWEAFLSVDYSRSRNQKERKVSLKMVYIRTDGEYGRVIPLKMADVTVVPSPEIQEVIDFISENQTKSTSLSRFINLFGNKLEKLPLYTTTKPGSTLHFDDFFLMKVLADGKITGIEFEVNRVLHQDTPSIDFSGLVHIFAKEGQNDESVTLKFGDALSVMDFSGWVIHQNYIILINFKHADEIKLVKTLLEWRYIPAAAILHILEQMGNYQLTFPINFPYKEIEYRAAFPVPQLSIAEDWKGLLLEISFRYGDETFFLDQDKDKIISLDSNNAETYVCGYRETDFEQNCVDLIEEFLDSDLKSEAMFREQRSSYSYSYYEIYNTIILNCNLDAFMNKYAEELMEKGVELRWHQDNRKWQRLSGTVEWNITSGGVDWLEIQPFLDSEGKRTRLLLEEDTIRLDEGDKWYIIDPVLLEQIKKIRQHGVTFVNGVAQIQKNRVDVLNLLYDQVKTVDNTAVEFMDRIKKLRNIEQIEETPIPSGFSAKLRHYQQGGYNWLKFLYNNKLNGCLADDMGLGKTVQTLCLIQDILNSYSDGKVLIVQPVSTMGNWEREIDRFCTGLSVLRHFGSDRVSNADEMAPYQIVLVSYATVRNDIELFCSLEWNAIILDESQAIKNPSTATFKAVKLLQGEFRLCLTGTPVENSTIDLWAQMDFLNPGLLGSHNFFKKGLGKDAGLFPRGEAANRLRKQTSPFLLRRKKSDVLEDLPEKEEIVEFIEMIPSQRKFYDGLKKQCQKKMLEVKDEAGGKQAFLLLQSLTRLRQAAIWPGLGFEDQKKHSSGKLDALESMISEICSEGNKMIIFSQFTGVLDRVEQYVQEKELGYSKLTGKTRKRDEQIDAFQNDPDIQLFLISLKAGGTGINLTAADYVVIVDPWWNPAVEMQAVDRAHRIGRKEKVIVYRLITSDSIEEKVLALQEKKRELVRNLITEDEGFFKSLSSDEISSLFE